MAAEFSFANKFDIPDNNSSFGFQAVWGIGNDLLVFNGKNTGDENIQVNDVVIHNIRWNTEMYSDIMRKIVNETHHIFMKVQSYASESVDKIETVQITKFSREYRCVIKACLMDLHKIIYKSNKDDYSNEEFEDYEAQLQLFDMVELVWSLCEILFIDIHPGAIVIPQLLEWLRWHFVEANRTSQEIMQHDSPHKHSQFWDVIFGFTLQGRIEDACQLLLTHPFANSNAFRKIVILMRRMPFYTFSTGQSVGDFETRWNHWQQDCNRCLVDGEFSTETNIETIAKILCGEDQVFLDLSYLCESWYCMLVSRILYQNPTTKAYDLQYHTQFCINAYGGNTLLQPWDNILLSAIEYNIHQLIKEASSSGGNWWFVAHITDLLHHCGVLETQSLDYGSNMREFLILEYASSLLSHNSLWQLGINYLDHCSEFGRSFQEHYLERLSLESDLKAQKVLQICLKRDMHEMAQSICRQKGLKAVKKSRLGSALSWAILSKDTGFVSSLTEKFLDHYSKNGDIASLDLIDNLGSSMFISTRLTFLGQYREFHKLYEQREFQAAGTLLLSLLTARLAPRNFWFTLMADALPFLESPDMIFDTQQTYELLHCLQEMTHYEDIVGSKSSKNSCADEATNNKLEMLRLALARNLARSIVSEGKISA